MSSEDKTGLRAGTPNSSKDKRNTEKSKTSAVGDLDEDRSEDQLVIGKPEKTGENFCLIYNVKGLYIRYPDPIVKINDSIKWDINTDKIMDSIKFEAGNLCMVTGGRNTGRVGTIMHRERHPGSFDIVHVKVKNFQEIEIFRKKSLSK